MPCLRCQAHTPGTPAGYSSRSNARRVPSAQRARWFLRPQSGQRAIRVSADHMSSSGFVDGQRECWGGSLSAAPAGGVAGPALPVAVVPRAPGNGCAASVSSGESADRAVGAGAVRVFRYRRDPYRSAKEAGRLGWHVSTQVSQLRDLERRQAVEYGVPVVTGAVHGEEERCDEVPLSFGRRVLLGRVDRGADEGHFVRMDVGRQRCRLVGGREGVDQRLDHCYAAVRHDEPR